MLVSLLILMASAQQADACTAAYDPEICRAAAAASLQAEINLDKCLIDTGERIGASGLSLGRAYAAYGGACRAERGVCVESATGAQIAKSTQKIMGDRGWSIALENAMRRCDDRFSIFARRTLGPKTRQY